MGDLTFRQIEEEIARWIKHNFPDQESYQALLGVSEEVGELCHAHLKGSQGIRGDAAQHRAEARDAIGDIIIYLIGYCLAEGYSIQDAVQEAWAVAGKRDWRADPEKGGEA